MLNAAKDPRSLASITVCPCCRVRGNATSPSDHRAYAKAGLGIVRYLDVRSLPHLAGRRLLELTST